MGKMPNHHRSRLPLSRVQCDIHLELFHYNTTSSSRVRRSFFVCFWCFNYRALSSLQTCRQRRRRFFALITFCLSTLDWKRYIFTKIERRKRVRVNSILSAAYRIDDIPPLLWCWYSIETWYETRSQQGSAQVDKLRKSIKRNFKLVFGSTSTQTSASKKSIFSHHRLSDRQGGGSSRQEFTILIIVQTLHRK